MPKSVTLYQARAAKAVALARFGNAPSVAGVGITAVPSGYGVKLNFNSQPPRELLVPDEIDGVPLIVSVVGKATKR